jgi:8-oxo-dGTP pyrophosphatase MutT (NUDIX family)
VREETGLTVTEIMGEGGYFREGNVECMRPFSVYQMLEGYIDSVGFHFICRAEGEVLEEGDWTRDIRWVTVDELERILAEEEFLGIDKVAARLYIKERKDK